MPIGRSIVRGSKGKKANSVNKNSRKEAVSAEPGTVQTSVLWRSLAGAGPWAVASPKATYLILGAFSCPGLCQN